MSTKLFLMDTRGERLRAWIKVTFGSQVRASEELGINRSQLSEYCTDATTPSIDVIDKFAEAGLNVHWWVTGIGAMEVPDFPDPHGQLQPRRIYIEIDGKLVPYEVAPPDKDEDQEHKEEED